MIDLATLARLAAEATEFAPGYLITRDGRVLSRTKWRGQDIRELAQEPNNDGYLCVRVVLHGKRQRLTVHTIVASNFVVGRREWNDQVRHLDGDKTNNSVENLAWGSAKDNAADRERHGRTARGSRNGFAKLDERTVREIKRRIGDGATQRRVAAEFGVSPSTVGLITQRKIWAHV